MGVFLILSGTFLELGVSSCLHLVLSFILVPRKGIGAFIHCPSEVPEHQNRVLMSFPQSLVEGHKETIKEGRLERTKERKITGGTHSSIAKLWELPYAGL